MRLAPCIALLCALAAAGCTTGPDVASPVGSRGNPVVCAGRPDAYAYLDRLRCPDGSAPDWTHVGDAPGGPYGAPLDRYRVRCAGLDRDALVYFDRRHRPIEEKDAPDGFALAPASADTSRCGMTDGCSEP